MNTIRSLQSILVGFRFFRQTTRVSPYVTQTSTTSLSIGAVPLIAILGALGMNTNVLEHLGSFIAKILPPKSAVDPEVFPTEFAVAVINLNEYDVDLTSSFLKLQAMKWLDADNQPLRVEFDTSVQLAPVQFFGLLSFRGSLKSSQLLDASTVYALAASAGTTIGRDTELLLQGLSATKQGDPSFGGSDDPQQEAWAKGLVNRITTGGPNGALSGNIAVNFMSTVPVAAASFNMFSKGGSTRVEGRGIIPEAMVTILKNAVLSAAESAASGLADYLKTLKQPGSGEQADTDADRQTATVVKGIKDSMPATGKTVAQLAVFNALNSKEIAQLSKPEQLRCLYTVANATRGAVEATGNHVADLYQTNSIPNDEELAAVGGRSLLDFLKSVGTTVAHGVLQAAPVVLNAVLNSSNASSALGSTLPPQFMSLAEGLHELDDQTKITLASRLVNGRHNPQANTVAEKATADLAERSSTLGAQAAIDTFINTPSSVKLADDPEARKNFRNIALEVAELVPALSNVTDVGATNLINDADLKHADSLRQETLAMGLRSGANMLAENETAEILYQVHLYRVKQSGNTLAARGFLDFLKSAVPIAAGIAKTVAPALLAVL